MTKDDIDQMWNQAMNEAVKNGENFTRYRFAALVAKHEREACEMAVEDMARKYPQWFLLGKANKHFCAD